MIKPPTPMYSMREGVRICALQRADLVVGDGCGDAEVGDAERGHGRER